MTIEKKADFHVHYDPGDETTAYAAIQAASNKGVAALSVMAKDEISDNVAGFVQYGQELGVVVLPGVEYSARINGSSVDLICLGFNPNDEHMREVFGKSETRQRNASIARSQKTFLESSGFSFLGLNPEDRELYDRLLAGDISEKAIRFCEIAVRHQANKAVTQDQKAAHFEDWSNTVKVESGKVYYKDNPEHLDAKFLYNIFFAIGRPGNLKVTSTTRRIIDVVHGAEGVALYSPEGKFDYPTWQQLKDEKVDGIMGWHAGGLGCNGHNTLDIPFGVIKEARKEGYLVLGGSDFQGKDWQIANGNGAMYISSRRLDDIYEYLKQKRSG